jgi:D-beta-D-heptose 7-phosphate kinase/D-beta-D-heptose 1-phosphate adenosyltransferase
MKRSVYFASLLKRFSRVQVLVIGDLMLDRYIWGQVERISPEAPVPVVRVTRESTHAGGAGNVVANAQALGGNVMACGIVGRDQAGRRLVQELSGTGAGVAGVVASQAATTISKTRIIAQSQQVVRLDREQGHEIDGRVRARVRAFVQRQLENCDVVVVSDYGKGVIDAELLNLLAARRQRHHFIYLIDPKRRNFPHYRGASLVKPNQEEAALAAGIEIHDESGLRQAGARLLDLWQTEAVLVSRGEEGMSLFKRQGRAQHFSTMAREVFDVTGAGDTVLATCALALGAGASLEEATILANHAAGIAVGKVGTATVSPAELTVALQERKP